MIGEQATVEIFDQHFQLAGFLNAPTSLDAVWRLNEASTATIVLPMASPKSWLLTTEGHRVRITVRGLIWSGWLDAWELDGIGPAASVTATFASDLTWFQQVLCWPADGTIPGTLPDESDDHEGPAETVLKDYADEFISRLGLPWRVAGDYGRGSVIKASMRMETPADKLLPAMQAAGIRVTLLHLPGDAHLTLDVSPIATYTRTLTAASGVIGQDTKVSVKSPTASRVVVGGAGEGTARLFRQIGWTEVEDAWGRRTEKFVDARDAQLDAANPLMDTAEEVEAVMDTRATTALDEANAAIAVNATLSETRWFQVRAGVLEVGDRVPLDITVPTGDPLRPFHLQVTETITEVTLSWEAGKALTVTPKLGKLVDDPSGPVLTRVAQISRTLRQYAARP